MIFRIQTDKTYKDYGPRPYVTDIRKATQHNDKFRTVLWTGEHLQLTLMSIPANSEIGLEKHDNLDQFLRLEAGNGLVIMGKSPDKLDYKVNVTSGFTVLIPAGTYHNLINKGNVPIKLYSIYAPPQHPRETTHKSKSDADKAEH